MLADADDAGAEGGFGSFATSGRASCRVAVAGIRPQDCRVTEASAGTLAGAAYTTELMGDHSLVTCRMAGAMVTVKADKSFAPARRRRPSAPSSEAVHIFDKASGDRIG